jgi:hypothetical protein
MNNKFDELAKGMAQSVTRRQALKKFGVSLAGMALACFGLASIVKAAKEPQPCLPSGNRCAPGAQPCCHGLICYAPYQGSDGFFCAPAPKHSKGGSGTGGT